MLAWLWTRLSDGGAQVSISGRALRRFPEREVDRLLRARVLVEERKADSWSVCSHCDCGIDARPVRQVGEELRACCPRDVAEDLVLDEQDVRRFGLDPEKLAARIAASGGLAGGIAPIAEGIWAIGTVPSGVAVMLCAGSEMLKAPGTIFAIKAAAGPRPVTIVACAPDIGLTLRLREVGIQLLPLAEAFRTGADGQDRLAIETAPIPEARVRLVLRRNAQTATLDGRHLELPMQPFVLLRLLAEQLFERDPVLKAQTIERELGRTPREIVRDLRLALAACGLDKAQVNALIRTVRNRGYRLGREPAEVSIEG